MFQENNIGLENIFVYLLIIYGIIIVFLTPPMQSPDENGHFGVAYSLSQFHITGGTIDGKSGIIVNENVSNFIQHYENKFAGNLDAKYTFKDMYLDSHIANRYGDSDKVAIYPYWKMGSDLIGVIRYSVQTLGIFFSNILFGSKTPYNALVCAKLFNLIFFIIIVHIALKITPVYKNTIFLLATMPMTVSLASSVSRDAGLIAISILFFSYLLMIMLNDKYKISYKDIIYMSLIAVCLYDFKVVMLPFLSLIIFIDKSKFKYTKQRLFFYIIPIVSILAVFVFNHCVQVKDIPHPNVYKQIEYLKDNIIEIPKIIYNTVDKFHGFYQASFYGNLGLLDINFPKPMVSCFFIILFLIAIYDGLVSKKISYKVIFSSLAIVLAIFLMLIMYFYITWTPLPSVGEVGLDYSTGFQGRYIIPFAIFFLLGFASLSQKNSKVKGLDEKVGKIAIVTGLINLNMTVLVLLLRYWV